ncbi:MAG: hypothetical protein ACD_79C01379G0001 [uncultured bacterium]|nr:MAG: hypothetical protein ACD_79C01379G0001 [uncultured bacterium]
MNNKIQFNKEKEFWEWFEKKSKIIFNFEQDKENIFNELSSKLNKIHSDLTFEIGPKNQFIRDFIISANGIADAFPAVIKLVNTAPKFDQWNIIPFRPRCSIENIINIDDYSLCPDNVWFKIEPLNGKVGLSLFISGLNEKNEKAVNIASYILLDNALGEYDVEVKLGYIKRYPLPVNPSNKGLIPFRKFPEEVDIMFKGFKGQELT